MTKGLKHYSDLLSTIMNGGYIGDRDGLNHLLNELSDEDLKIINGIIFDGCGRDSIVPFDDPEKELIDAANHHKGFSKEEMVLNITSLKKDALRLYIENGKKLFCL